MPSPRHLLIKAIYDDLSAQNLDPVVLAADQIDQIAREGVMQEELRALPAFFSDSGIYARLLEKHPEFRSPATAEEAENSAIRELVEEIEKRLAVATDRLTGRLVGAEAAREAILNHDKRYRREYHLRPGERTFDEIGQLHSALRLILNDNTVAIGSTWRTPYFDGCISFRGHTYRHYLALLWKGATEPEIEAPLTHIGLQSDELRKIGVTQMIAALAQCRREHNYDGSHPDWEQQTTPQDCQRCDMGLRGDLFGQMLLHNEYYMQTRTNLNLEQIEPLIRDIIFEKFAALETATKVKVVSYLDNKSIMMLVPESDEIDAVRSFIDLIKTSALEKLIDKINEAEAESPLYKIKQYMDNIRQKAGRGDAASTAAIIRLMDNFKDYVKLEADSLLLDDHTNSANIDFLRRFANDGISQVYQDRLVSALRGDSDAIRRHTTQYLGMVNKVNSLSYIIDSELIKAAAFTEAPFAEERKRRLQDLIDHYKHFLNESKNQILLMIDRFSDRSIVDERFGFVGDSGVNAFLARQQEAFVRSQGNILIQINALELSLDRMMVQLEHPDIIDQTLVRSYLRPLVMMFPAEKQTPEFYAKYLWTLLHEKTPAGHYVISDTNDNELQKTLDLIFGNEVNGIAGLEFTKKNLILYGFNLEIQSAIFAGERQEKIAARCLIVSNYLRDKGIDLRAAERIPSQKQITIAETAYKASMKTPRIWQNIIELSGKIGDLITFIDAPAAEQLAASNNPQQLMNVAMNLPISYYSPPGQVLDIERQQRAMTIWCEIAKAIYAEDHTGDLLVNFVTQTLMANLGIGEFSKNDHQIIKRIVETYMLNIPYNSLYFPLPFMPQTTLNGSIVGLGNHLSVLLSTLNVPTIKFSFETGIVRLMSRSDAVNAAGIDRYVLRVSNLKPSELVVTTNDNAYLNSTQSVQIRVSGTALNIGIFQGNEFINIVNPLIGGRLPVTSTLIGASEACAPLRLEDMASPAYQAMRAGSNNYYSSSYGCSVSDSAADSAGFSRVESDMAVGHRHALEFIQAQLLISQGSVLAATTATAPMPLFGGIHSIFQQAPASTEISSLSQAAQSSASALHH